MKKLSSLLNKLSNKHFMGVWIIFHAAVFLSFGITFAARRGDLKIDADLMNMLPASFDEESISKANEKLNGLISERVYILVSNPDFKKAKETAITVYDQLKDSPKFASVSLYSDLSSLTDVTDFIYKNRWNLLDDAAVNQINAAGGEIEFAENALAQAYGGFTMTSLDNLDKDPFMLNEYNLNMYLNALQNSGTAMTMKDGVLASEYDGRWYVLIQGNLSKEGMALASNSNAVAQIYSICDPLEDGETRFVYSSTPFHSYKSSTEASREITLISVISLLAVVVILLMIFRSPTPIVLSVASILISIVTAIAGTLTVFHKMHLITLIFGTSLIGSCIDYSLHYFINWKANTKLTTGDEIRKHLLKGLGLSLVSTVICYTLMMFAPYNLVKQMGLFSIIGLISSFLTTIAVFPYIPVPKSGREIKSVVLMKKPHWWNKKIIGRIVVTCFFAVPLLLIAIFFKNGTIQNNLNKLYTMEGRLKENELEASHVLKFAPYGWFIVRGDSTEDVLVREEKLADTLREYRDENGNRIGFLATSSFIPSIKKQKESRAACDKLMEIADFQLEALGFEPEYTDALWEEYNSSADDFVSIDKGNVPAFLMESISSAWIGEINGKYYSVLLPTECNDYEYFRSVAETDDNLYYLNKMQDVSEDLDTLTKMILLFFVAAFVILFVILRFFYNTKRTAKIISVPVLIVIMVYAVFSVAKIHLEFFSIVGVILVMGLGMDYIIYMIENERKSQAVEETQILEPFGILLSFITTSISFGALALSKFMPVHYIGLSIFIGLMTAYFASFFYDRS